MSLETHSLLLEPAVGTNLISLRGVLHYSGWVEHTHYSTPTSPKEEPRTIDISKNRWRTSTRKYLRSSNKQTKMMVPIANRCECKIKNWSCTGEHQNRSNNEENYNDARGETNASTRTNQSARSVRRKELKTSLEKGERAINKQMGSN